MNRKIVIGTLITVSLVAFSACGGGGSSVSSSKGYYLDSAVEGVSYQCGSKSGVTEADGSFEFENGQNCQFELAGLTLREVSSTNLHADVEIIEDNMDVAKLLQSLDYDGNPDNGIQINSAVKEELKAYIHESGAKHVKDVSDDEVLNSIIDDIHKKHPDSHSHLRSEAEVKAHLEKTKAKHAEKHKDDDEDHSKDNDKDHDKDNDNR